MMAITKQQARRLRNLMTRRVNAAVENAFKGSQPPEEAEQLEYALARAEDNLDTYIKELTEK
jgi:hypothetical protein